MNKIDWKQIWQQSWPHMVAIVAFVLMCVIYFAPEFFDNKQLPQGDVQSGVGMGHDARLYHEKTGEYADWSNAMFGGMPHNYAYSQPSKSVFRTVEDVVRIGLPNHTAAPLFLYLLGFYVFMLCVGCSPWMSILGAIAFALASYNIIIIDAGHINKCYVIATMPAVLGGIMLCYRKRYVAGIIVTLLSLGLNVYWNHQQISYYLLLMIIPLAIVYFIVAIREKTVKDFFVASAVLLLCAVMAIMPAADKLIPTMDYTKETMRGGAVLHDSADSEAGKSGLNRDYAFQWSYGKAETMTLLIPNFYGGSSNYPLGDKSETYKTLKKYAGASQARQYVKALPTYWGDQPFTSGPVYAGAIICFLFVLGLIVVPQKERWWLLVAAVIGIVLSWGRNFPSLNNWLFDHLPLYNKFRTPSMALVMTTTAMAIMAMLALKEVVERHVTLKQVGIAGGVTAGLCLLYALFPSLAGSFTTAVDAQLPDWLSPSIIADRQHLLTADAWRSIAFIVLSAAAILAYLKSEKMRNSILVAILAVLTLVDLWAVDKHFLNDDHFIPKRQSLWTPTDADKQIMADTDPDYRVLNLTSNTFNESRTSYYHKSIGGYSPAKLRRYQDIIDYYLSGRINMNVLNMLNTRYVITQNGAQLNPTAFGNAWFVKEIRWVNTPNEEIEAIGDADLKEVAFIDTCWRSKVQSEVAMTQPAFIELANYANPGNLFYESESAEDGLAVFSEVYYKTWKAYVDGKEVPIVRANYILRAVEIPAGKHTIEFRCKDELLQKSQVVSVAASALIALIILLLLIFRRKIE